MIVATAAGMRWNGVIPPLRPSRWDAGRTAGLAIGYAVERCVRTASKHENNSALRADRAFMANDLHSLW